MSLRMHRDINYRPSPLSLLRFPRLELFLLEVSNGSILLASYLLPMFYSVLSTELSKFFPVFSSLSLETVILVHSYIVGYTSN